MDDLVARLRRAHVGSVQQVLGSHILIEAADEIQRLNARLKEEYEGWRDRKERERMRGALQKISAKGHEHPDPYIEGSWFAGVADAALGSTNSGEGKP